MSAYKRVPQDKNAVPSISFDIRAEDVRLISVQVSNPIVPEELVVPWLFLAFLRELEQEVLDELRDEELAREETEPTEDLTTELVF